MQDLKIIKKTIDKTFFNLCIDQEFLKIFSVTKWIIQKSKNGVYVYSEEIQLLKTKWMNHPINEGQRC